MEFSLQAQFILYRDFGVCAPRPYWTPRWCVMPWREPWVPYLGSLQAAICTVVWNALKRVWEFHIWVPSRPLSARYWVMPWRESGGFHIGFPYSFKENKNKIKSFSFFKDWFCSVVFFLFVFKDFILVKLRFSFWLVEV